MQTKLVLKATCAALCVAVCWTGASRAADDPSLADVRKQKVKAAEEWVAAMAVADWSVPYNEHYGAMRSLKNARLEVASNKGERLQALQHYLDQVKGLYNKIDALREEGAAGGEAYWWRQARFRVVEAQVWLLEAKTKP
jgi:hypothetical protein